MNNSKQKEKSITRLSDKEKAYHVYMAIQNKQLYGMSFNTYSEMNGIRNRINLHRWMRRFLGGSPYFSREESTDADEGLGYHQFQMRMIRRFRRNWCT